jgi:hypothetical protein
LVTHHDAGEKVAQGRRPGVVTAGFVPLVGDKAMPLDGGPKLKSVQRFAIHCRDGPPRFPFLPRPALGELPSSYFFENGFDFEHSFLLIDFAPS